MNVAWAFEILITVFVLELFTIMTFGFENGKTSINFRIPILQAFGSVKSGVFNHRHAPLINRSFE